MVNILLNHLRKNNKAGTDGISIATPTGNNIIDILSSEVLTDINGYPILNCGLYPKQYGLIAESGTGKSTLALQLACSVANGFQNGLATQFDLESNTTKNRVLSLTGWDDVEYYNKFTYYDESHRTQDIRDIINNIANFKENNKKYLQYTTNFVDTYGWPISAYEPTIVIIDSVAKMASLGRELIETDKIGNVLSNTKLVENTDGMIEAKNNKAFMSQVKPKLTKYNICLIMINHLVEEPVMKAFQAPKRYHPNLPPGFKIQGGSEIIFQSFGLIDLKLKETINPLKNPVYGSAVDGFVSTIRFIKNKSAVSGIGLRMVFDKRKGYIPELSDWEYLYTNKYGFSGSPSSYRLDILPEISFTRKSLYNICKTNYLFSRALAFTAQYKMIMDLVLIYENFAPLSKMGEEMSYNERCSLINLFSKPYAFNKQTFNLEDINSISKGNLYKTQDLLNSYHNNLLNEKLLYQAFMLENSRIMGFGYKLNPFTKLDKKYGIPTDLFDIKIK